MTQSKPPRLFGTDGIRGVANQYPIIPEIASRFGSAVAYLFRDDRPGAPILIGRDTRQSGPMLEDAVAAGIVSMGRDVLLAGVLPTPAVAYLTRALPAAAGIVISASHNPFPDNGLKVFRHNGYKCDDPTEERLAELILGRTMDPARAAATRLGATLIYPNAAASYVEMILKDLAGELDLRGIRAVVDAANGAAYQTTPLALRRLGAEVAAFHDQPNGCNINENCGSTHPEVLASLIRQHGGAIGIAHDGDADRVLICDETGSVLDGDEVLAILGLDYLQRGLLADRTLVATVMSNLGLDECIAAAGGKVIRAAVGDRYVLEQMLKHNLNLGGEQSGHVILLDRNTTGDGLGTALEILRIMKRAGRPLSRLRRAMKKYPQLLVNVPVRERIPFESLPEVMAALRAVETELGRQGRVFLRYSGTEPKARLLIETKEESQLTPLANRILTPLRAALGA